MVLIAAHVRSRRADDAGRLAVWGALVGVLTLASPARAQLPHEDCQEPDPARSSCTTTADCRPGLRCIRDGSQATTGTCRVACASTGSNTTPDLSNCGYGEACVSGEEMGARDLLYCKPVPFSMDLNLLDSCIYHFVEGLQPVGLTDPNTCSLARNLAQMLERDGTAGFGIFDVDRCIQDFLAEAPVQPCTGGDCLFCTADAQCGDGAFCNQDLNRCERECGWIVDRGAEGGQALERQCSGRMKVCNERRGQCEEYVQGGESCQSSSDCASGLACVSGQCETRPADCQVDGDCPSGAYCFLGQCQPTCFRSLECPDSQWFCSEKNRCERKPAPNPPAGFDPARYSILFGRQAITIDGVNSTQELPLMIMDTVFQRPVFGDGNILFGYRLLARYSRKVDPICAGDLSRSELTDLQRSDCVIAPEEEFLIIENPFGTVYGDGRQALTVRLNEEVARTLTPGQYPVTLQAIFSNGSSSSMTVTYNKPSPDGLYAGTLKVAVDDVRANLVANTGVSVGLKIHRSSQLTWDQLLAKNNLLDVNANSVGEREFRDVTYGYEVEGAIYGNESVVFNNPEATSNATNEIAIRGLYSPQYRRLRLLSIVKIGGTRQWCRDGSCQALSSDDGQLRVANPFGRDVRRRIEWIGTFDEVTRRFKGYYRETLAGLFPHLVTLQGEFDLRQTQQDPGLTFVHGQVNDPLVPPNTPATVFPAPGDVYNAQVSRVNQLCSGTSARGVIAADPNDLDTARLAFAGKAAFSRYVRALDAPAGGPVIPSVAELGGGVAQALGTAGTATPVDALTVADLLRDSVQRCPANPVAPYPNFCVDVPALECGLALHTKALLARDPIQDTAATCTSSADCSAGACVYSQADGAGRCRTLCNRAAPTACTSNEVCGPDLPVEGQQSVDICMPTSGGWVERAAVARELTGAATGASGQASLFCDRRRPTADARCESAVDAPNVTAFQEYLWFYKNLHETYAFDAGRDVSDAFFQLYRDAYLTGANALDLSGAYRDKVALLKSALGHYDDARRQMFSPATALVAIDWPMLSFDGRGLPWLTQMHTVLHDRSEALFELVDLQSRILRQDMRNDSLFYHHVFHQEYLAQVFLAVLQKYWEGPGFAYAGEGPAAMTKGQKILQRVDEANNPLGLRPDRTYFENNWSSGATSNVQLYRNSAGNKLNQLVGPNRSGGLVASAKTALQNALRNERQLVESLTDLRQQLDAELLQMCGPDTALPTECSSLENLDRELATQCTGPECPVSFMCEDARCDTVARVFRDTLNGSLEEVSCRADTPVLRIYQNPDPNSLPEIRTFMSEKDLPSRLCVRGEVGALLQERVSLNLTREETVRKARGLIRQLAIREQLMRKIGSSYDNIIGAVTAAEGVRTALELMMSVAEADYAASEAAVQSASCLFITPVGTGGSMANNCILVGPAATKMAASGAAKASAAKAYRIGLAGIEMAKTIANYRFQEETRLAAIQSEMDQITSEVESYIGQYQSVIQQMQALDVRIVDKLVIAQSRWLAYNDNVQAVVDRLTGNDSRWTMVRNSAAMNAQSLFQSLLLDLYKMVQATAYRYDLPKGEVDALRNQVYQLVTAGQVSGFLDDFDCRLSQFAGQNSLDPNWDNPSDAPIFIFSVRNQLFPQLRDIVDPDTGAVLTADEQFHRIITSPPYLRTVVSASGPEQRIIIPFATSMGVRPATSPGRPALVNRNQCNHVLIGATSNGSTLLNFQVWNPRPDSQGKDVVHANLTRGTVDHMRSCSEQYPTSGMPVVRSYTFGNAYRDSDVPLPNAPVLFESCVNQHNVLTTTNQSAIDSLTCWRTGFTERTLGSPDWVVTIDALRSGEDNQWILHTPAIEPQPVIRDIEVVFRHTVRPMGSATFQCVSP